MTHGDSLGAEAFGLQPGLDLSRVRVIAQGHGGVRGPRDVQGFGGARAPVDQTLQQLLVHAVQLAEPVYGSGSVTHSALGEATLLPPAPPWPKEGWGHALFFPHIRSSLLGTTCYPSLPKHRGGSSWDPSLPSPQKGRAP